MKDLSIIKDFVELGGPTSDWGNYKFSRPRNTTYLKIFKYIKENTYATRHEVYEKFLANNELYHSEAGYYGTFWIGAQIAGMIKKYRYKKNIFYMLTEKGKNLVEKTEKDIKKAEETIRILNEEKNGYLEIISKCESLVKNIDGLIKKVNNY